MPTPCVTKKPAKKEKEWKLIDLNRPSELTRLNIARFIYGLASMTEGDLEAEIATLESKPDQKSA
jgi:hypothetical protein